MITILGRNPVLEALKSGQNISDIYIKEGIKIDDKVSEILNLAKSNKIRFKFVSKRFLDNLSENTIHQGIAATKTEAIKRKLEVILKDFESRGIQPKIVFIREAQNEFNVGGIIRTAESAGANLIILPPKTHLSPQMIRASMGASEHVEIINEGLFQAIKLAKEWLVKVVGIELTGNKYYYEDDLTGPLMLIIGGEDRSLSREVTDKCDSVVKIPMLGKVNSLNMSVALAIVLYEKVKQDACNK